MNLAQASMHDLRSAFDVDVRQFLAQFDGAVQDVCGARDAQALGAAGEALRGIRLGAEFLGFEDLGRACREVEQELLRQLPLLASRDAGAARRVRELASTLHEAVGGAIAAAAAQEPGAEGAAEPASPIHEVLPEWSMESAFERQPQPEAEAESAPEAVPASETAPETEPVLTLEPEPEPTAGFEPEPELEGPPVQPLADACELPPRLAPGASAACRWDAQEASRLLRDAVQPLHQSVQQTHDLLREHVQGWDDMRDALLQAVAGPHEAGASAVEAAPCEPPRIEMPGSEAQDVELQDLESQDVGSQEAAPPLDEEPVAAPSFIEALVDEPEGEGARDAPSIEQ